MKNSRMFRQNTITFVRSLLAASLLLTLIFTPMNGLFRSEHISGLRENVRGLMQLNFFLWSDSVYLALGFSYLVLALVILGVYPRITCILHTWVTYSCFYTMVIVEGGDQINAILTCLIVPISILDNRKNGWKIAGEMRVNSLLQFNASMAMLAIRVQMALLYLNAGISKIFAPEWSNGTAIYYWFNDAMFGAPHWLRSTIGFLFTNILTVSLINWSVIFLEILLFTGLFIEQKFRYLLFVLAFLFHFAIVIVHGLPTFWLAMTGGLILFLFRPDLSIMENIAELKKVTKIKIPFNELRSV